MAPLTRGGLRVRGSIRAPGDKSISHRALILASIARGSSRIENILDSADVQSTAEALRVLGARVPALASSVYVEGREMHSPRKALDCGNSGTTTRLLAGVIAGAGLRASFEGDASLSRRPMRRVAEPLIAMGARVALPAHGGLPMTVEGGDLHGIEYESTVSSAQVKSAILLASLLAGVRTRVTEPHLSRDHTERMLAARGIELRRDGTAVEILPAQTLLPLDVRVPADPSSAAFFVALAMLADEGEIRVMDVCLNESRTGFLSVLRRMGGKIEIADRREEGGEVVGTIVARPSQLRALEITEADVPSMIDELPLFACVAARVSGECIVRGAAELRVKESDRIATVVNNLRSLGADADELADGFIVRGSRAPLRGGVETRGDHRMAMSFAVLGALAGNQISIDDPNCVIVSYPNFWQDLERVQR